MDRQDTDRHHSAYRPQSFIAKLQQDVLPEYRRLASNLIDRFISEFEAQGGRRIEITEHIEKMYKWKQ